MRKNIIAALAIAMLTTLPALGQRAELTTSYNMRMGTDAMAEGDYRSAVDAFFKEKQENPGNAYADFYIGTCYHSSGFYGAAIDYFSNALKNFAPKDKEGISETLSKLGLCFMEVGLPDVARKKIEEAVAAMPNAFNYAQLAANCYLMDDVENGTAYARKALKAAKDAPGEAYIIQRTCMATRRTLAKAHGHDKAMQAELEKHIVATLNGDWSNADPTLRHELQMEKVWVTLELKGAKAAVGEFMSFYNEAAEESVMTDFVKEFCDDERVGNLLEQKFEKLAKTQSSTTLDLALAIAHQSNHHYRESLAKIKKINAERPDWKSDILRIECLEYGGKMAEAAEAERASIANTTDDTLNIYYNVAKKELYAGLLDKARADLDVFLAARPASPSGHELSGMLNLHTGNLDEAQRELELAILFDPTLPISHLELAAVFLAKGETDRANENYRQLLDLEDAHPQYHALAAAHLGDKTALAESVKKMNADGENHYVMACIASILRDKAETLRQIRQHIDKGFWANTPKMLMQDTDFAWLREDADFRALVNEFSRRIEDAWK